MTSLPRVYTPSQISALWSPASLPVGISAETLQALRDVFLVLDAAQGGFGVVDIAPLRRALEAKDALLWCSDSSSSSDDDNDDDTDDVSLAETTLIDFYGLIQWWAQHVGEEGGASRAVSPISTRSPVATALSAPTSHFPTTPLSTTLASTAGGSTPGKDAGAALWQPLRVLSTREANATAGARMGKRFSLASLRSPSPTLSDAQRGASAEEDEEDEDDEEEEDEGTLSTAARTQSAACRSLSASLSSCASSRRAECLQPLKPLSSHRGRSASADLTSLHGHTAAAQPHRHPPSRRGSTGHTTTDRPLPTTTAVMVTATASVPSRSPPRSDNHPRHHHHPLSRSESCATAASTAGSSSMAASRLTFTCRDGALWKVSARAHEVLRTFRTTTPSSAVSFSDTEVALFASAFEGFEGVKDGGGRVGIAALSRALASLVRAEVGEDDAACEATTEKIERAAASMIARACAGSGEEEAEAEETGGQSVPSFTRAQFVASFVQCSAAFPPSLLALLVRTRMQAGAACMAPLSRPPRLWQPSGTASSRRAQAAHELSPFDVSLLVELLARFRWSPCQPTFAAAAHDGVVPLETALTVLREGCFATAFDAAVASDRRACEALLTCVRDTALSSALCPVSFSAALHVDLATLIAALTSVTMTSSTVSAGAHLTPTRQRVARGVAVLTALQLPQTMLHRLVELIVSLDLHRPHLDLDDDHEPTMEREEAGNGDTTTTRSRSPTSSAAVRQLERLRRLRRAIPRTLGYMASPELPHATADDDHHQQHDDEEEVRAPLGEGVSAYFDTSSLYARLTALARAVVDTAAPRLVHVRRDCRPAGSFAASDNLDEAGLTSLAELSLMPFFQRLVALVAYVPRVTPRSTGPRLAEHALRATICALGFAGARDVAALLVCALQFQTAASAGTDVTDVPQAPRGHARRRTVHAMLPDLSSTSATQTRPTDAAESLSRSLGMLVAHRRADWSAAQCVVFVTQTFVPALTRAPRCQGWVDAGALLRVWLAVVPPVRFPSSASTDPTQAQTTPASCTPEPMDVSGSLLPRPRLPRYPLCEELAFFSPFDDVTSLYLSLRQITADVVPMRAASSTSVSPTVASSQPMHVSLYRAVQPIPFTRLHDFLVDAPRLFDVLRHLGWQDEVSADLVFLPHTLKATSLTPEGIYVKLHKLQRALVARRGPSRRRSDPASRHAHRGSMTGVSERPLWPLSAGPQATGDGPTRTPRPRDGEERREEEEEVSLCAKAYRLAHPIPSVLAAVYLFRQLTEPCEPSESSSDPACGARQGGSAQDVSMSDSLVWFDRLRSRLGSPCGLGSACWLHAPAHREDGVHWWRELTQCLFRCFQPDKNGPENGDGEVRRSVLAEASTTMAEKRLSLFEWSHGLLELRVRAAMGETRAGVSALETDMRPSLFIDCLLEHTKVSL